MADCASLLDEELSSFVFSYLTETSGSQYGEEEVSSDRLDADFPDIDLSQLDTSDFDSVNCLGELQWCSNQQAGASPASVHYSTADELFETEEENAALLAALTDSLDGMVDAEVGGLSVFPTLEEEEPVQEEEEEESRPLGPGDLSQVLGAESEDPSLLKKLLLSPPNLPAGMDTHKDRVRAHRYSNRSLHLRPVRPLVKSDVIQERKPRVVRPAGRLCTELHRHLTTAQDPESNPAPDTEEDEEEEDEEESESEEEEEEESSSSEVEGATSVLPEPAKPQFSSEKEMQSVVELITYMHTYCLPSRKQQGWERRDLQRSRARPDAAAPRHAARVVLVTAAAATGAGAARKLPFAGRREAKASSLLRELLQQSAAFDVSKPYRLHSPPYTHSPPPGQAAQAHPPGSSSPDPQPRKDSAERCSSACEVAAEAGGSFSVRRSLRLASFPSRFAKRLRPPRTGEGEGLSQDGAATGGGATTETQPERLTPCDAAERSQGCSHHEKRAGLRLPLQHRPTGRESQFSSKAFEQTLSVDLCGTAGLTPPTTPPHKPVEDELFKPTEGGRGGELAGEGSGGVAKGSPWLPRSHHQRKVPEQTELYAQLLRTAQTADGARNFGDHDYCALSLGEKRKRSAALLGAMFQVQVGDGVSTPSARAAEDLLADAKVEEDEGQVALSPAGDATESETMLVSSPPLSDCQVATPPSSEEEAEHSSASRSPSPVLHLCPDFPASKTDSSENSEMCSEEKQRSKAKCEEDNCQVFYIHNLPSGVTQNMLRKRFQVFGKAEDCKIIICNEERCGVIKIRQPGLQRHWRDRDALFQSGLPGLKRLTRKRYIDLDEVGPGPIKSKYEAPDFDTLLKEAQKTMQR